MATNISERVAITLPDEIKGGAGIEFLFAEVSKFFPAMPFAVVYYEENGKRVRLGLRLDLDKRVFLDHFDDKAKQEVLNRAAPEISAFVGLSRQGLKSFDVNFTSAERNGTKKLLPKVRMKKSRAKTALPVPRSRRKGQKAQEHR